MAAANTGRRHHVHNQVHPPPLFIKLAVLLLLAVLAGPAWAQTTVTSSGREGPTACVGDPEIDAANMPITALSTSGVTVTAPQVTWSQVIARLGDGQAPANSIISVNVFNAKTGTVVGNSGAVGVISSSSPTYAGGSVTRTGLEARTLYFIEVDAGITGVGQTLARRCFMTGGSYTMAVDPAAGRTSGCFSISPLTIQDVRNCLCGRGNNSPRVLGLFTDETQNQALRDSLGCR